jgi:hypothetical protein
MFQLRRQVNDNIPEVIRTDYKYSNLKPLKSELEKLESDPDAHYWITVEPPAKKETADV